MENEQIDNELIVKQDTEMEQAMNKGLLFHYATLSNLAEIIRTRTIKSGAARAFEVDSDARLNPKDFGSSPHGSREIIFETCFSLDGVELPAQGDGEESVGFLAVPFSEIARTIIPNSNTFESNVFMFFPNSFGGGPNFDKEVHVARTRRGQYGAKIDLVNPTTIEFSESDPVMFYVPESQVKHFIKILLAGTRREERNDLTEYIEKHLKTYRDIGDSDTSRVKYAAEIGHGLTDAYRHQNDTSTLKDMPVIKPVRTKITGNIYSPFHSRILEEGRFRPVYYATIT